jgi:hypothetical protein
MVPRRSLCKPPGKYRWTGADYKFRYTGDALGGLANASLGNATEFIIVSCIFLCTRGPWLTIVNSGYPPADKV